MSIGKTIGKLRKIRRFSQGELASEANITQAYLSSIENGKRDPTVSKLEAIALALSIPLPIIFFLSLEPANLPEGKRDLFEVLKPLMENLIEEYT